MRLILKHIYVLSIVFSTLLGYSQNNTFGIVEDVRFTLKGSVIKSDTREPIANVNIEVSGGGYTTTDMFGDFKIEAKKGDELIIRHKDFETVYYTIKDNERIIVEVEPSDEEQKKYKSKRLSRTKKPQFEWYIDSAKTHLKEDAKRSIQHITNALELSDSKKENAEAYEVLGDIYMYWKQYDLALSNYRNSLENNEINKVKLKLALAYKENKNYQESIQTYKAINKSALTSKQLVSFYEGLGDAYLSTQDYNQSLLSYNKGLEEAQKRNIVTKVTDLNSKIAEAYNKKGEIAEAEGYFNKSLSLSNTVGKKRAVEEKVKVADFLNRNNNYESEIELRQQALDDISEMDSIISNESPLTSQKQNYKIGRAYNSQNKYDKAIEYLGKSIEEAYKKEDLIVEKDAKRKLSEVYENKGDFTKALSTYKEYTDLVDKLYVRKEQEISQSARFSKNLVTKQNRIESLESERELSQSKYLLSIEQTKRQKMIIYSLFGGVLLLLLLAFFMFKYIKQQRLANNLLALKSLRSQMNPHFIFNALNSVNSFIASNDERTANKYLTDFSKLMRAVLENSEEDFIPLEKEMELLQLYTKLEHFRFQDKFDYTITVDEEISVKDFVIPPMLLQPYIENAVWHGLRYKKEKGVLKIAITQNGKEEIEIAIIDNGIGRQKSKALKTEHQQKQNSKGMGNIKKRVSILNDMYKDKVDVFISDYQDQEDTGTKVVVRLKKD